MGELRAYFAREAGGGLRADHVLVTSGGQSALTAAFRYLATPGDPVVLESPTYGGTVVAARAAGLRPVPVPADRDGVLPDALSYAIERTRAPLIYLQTRHANPTGATLAEDRRPAVLSVAARARAFVVEDDWARDLDLSGPVPVPLAARDEDGHVVYIRSLTKPVAAGPRVAALMARGPAFERLRLGRTSDDLFVAPILQHTALDVLTAPGWPRHLARVRRVLRERRDALLAALGRHAPQFHLELVPAGGMLLWPRLPPGVPATRLAAACHDRGLAVEPGDWYFPGEPAGSFVRLSYAAAEATVMATAAATLAAAARDCFGGRQ
jgi:DNA-binding transcriptional MocR family regulator